MNSLIQIVDPKTRAPWEPKAEYADYILTEHHESSADLLFFYFTFVPLFYMHNTLKSGKDIVSFVPFQS